MAETIPLGRYLWERIKQIGISKVFGVPGDFNLTLLDHIYDVEGLDWVGNTNELNAAYAADGYARVKKGAGCVVTTHGVGELSALNAIAGSMTEQVKVIHVVGQTSLTMQKNKMMIHHSIGSQPDHQVFNRASVGFRVAAAELQSELAATEKIDETLRQCFVKSGPVYIFVPIDLVDKQVPSKALETPLNLEPVFDTEVVAEATNAILDLVYASKHPSIFVDCLVHRHNAIKEATELVDKLNVLVYTSNMGKGIIDETHPNYLGVYNGQISAPGVESAVEASDTVLLLGNLPSGK
jgi:pyruvate decarboxylase